MNSALLWMISSLTGSAMVVWVVGRMDLDGFGWISNGIWTKIDSLGMLRVCVCVCTVDACKLSWLKIHHSSPLCLRMSFNPVILTRASEIGVDQPAFLQLNDASPAVQLRYVVEMRCVVVVFYGLFMFVSFPCFQLGFIHDVFSSLKLKCLLMFVAV